MQKPLLILVTGDPVQSAYSRCGNFAKMIQRAAGGAWSHAWCVTDLRSELHLPPADEVSGVIVTGSPALLSERTEWMLRGLDYIRELVAQDTPTLGICFGHQMLGLALGGKVGFNPEGREIGTVGVTDCAESPLLANHQSLPLTVNATHLDSVLELPSGAQRLASTALEKNAAVRFGPRAWGVQFHPEIDQEVMRCYISARAEALVSEGFVPARLSEQATDAPFGACVIANFVQHELLTSS